MRVKYRWLGNCLDDETMWESKTRTKHFVRYRTTIKPEHVGIHLFMGGTIQRHDIGRKLTVDVLDSGQRIDSIS